ncbi:MAG TPA: copper chaperone PCu(A)C [Streptosporangiaceae bacterium]|nr:copper chaperone PCu(A)C [Streptosporangiaceae bacterium]
MAAGLATAAALGMTGCAARAAADPIKLATAYVPVPASPGTTVAYVVIRNDGGADRLLSASTSAGGRVAFQAPSGPGPAGMHTVTSIVIPAHTTVSMVPDGDHMVITGAGPMRGGKDITLTLVFAHAGAVSVITPVTNPATGGSTYFFN